MKGYGQFCPVAKASEILAERWTPLVLRELLRGALADVPRPPEPAPPLGIPSGA